MGQFLQGVSCLRYRKTAWRGMAMANMENIMAITVTGDMDIDMVPMDMAMAKAMKKRRQKSREIMSDRGNCGDNHGIRMALFLRGLQ